MGSFDLEERLVNFSVLTMEIADSVPKNMNGINLAKQLSRSGTSAALNYGEAQGGESRKDFIHKMKVVLKELRETKICLELIARTRSCNKVHILEQVQKENMELILIFIQSIETARNNDAKEKSEK